MGSVWTGVMKALVPALLVALLSERGLDNKMKPLSCESCIEREMGNEPPN